MVESTGAGDHFVRSRFVPLTLTKEPNKDPVEIKPIARNCLGKLSTLKLGLWPLGTLQERLTSQAGEKA